MLEPGMQSSRKTARVEQMGDKSAGRLARSLRSCIVPAMSTIHEPASPTADHPLQVTYKATCQPDPRSPQRAHAPKATGRADRPVDPCVRVHQPDPRRS